MSVQDLLLQRQRLVYALGSTTRVVEFEDRRIEKFSPEELLTAIAGIDAELAVVAGRGESRLFTVASSTGLSGCNVPCCHGDVRDDRYEAWR